MHKPLPDMQPGAGGPTRYEVLKYGHAESIFPAEHALKSA
jgi:hypothetical protein